MKNKTDKQLDDGVRVSFKPKYRKMYFKLRNKGYSSSDAHTIVLKNHELIDESKKNKELIDESKYDKLIKKQRSKYI
jgi:hypothetical protein